MSRPSETISLAVGSILGAVFIVIGAFTGWEPSAELAGAITLLVSWVAALVTWWVARKQREGDLVSNPDGTVEG